MKMGLDGAKIVVAGSSRGMGLVIARAFVSEGAKVWLSGRDAKTLNSAAMELRAESTVCDLETESGRSALIEQVSQKWGKINGLVLNVGSGRSTHLGLDTPDSEWTRVFNLNFFSHAGLVSGFRPHFEKDKSAIVSISSIAGQVRLAAPVSYGTAKSALEHFCTSVVPELADLGVRYNIVAPGNVLVTGGRWEERLKSDMASVQQYISASVPLKRFATPEEIASAVVFLASPQSSFCTGTVLRVDGGQVSKGV